MNLLGGIAKRLKYPALASVPVSAAMLSRADSVTTEQHLDEVAQLFIAYNPTSPQKDKLCSASSIQHRANVP